MFTKNICATWLTYVSHLVTTMYYILINDSFRSIELGVVLLIILVLLIIISWLCVTFAVDFIIGTFARVSRVQVLGARFALVAALMVNLPTFHWTHHQIKYLIRWHLLINNLIRLS